MDKVKVLKIIRDEMGKELGDIKEDTPVINASAIDEVMGRDLVMRLEDELGITIPDEEAEKFVTVDDILNYLEATEKKGE